MYLYDQNHDRSSLRPLTYLLRRNGTYFELNFDVIMSPCAPGIGLHQETFLPNCAVFKHVYNKPLGVRHQKFEATWLTKSCWTGFLFSSFFPCGLSVDWLFAGIHTRCLPSAPASLLWLILNYGRHMLMKKFIQYQIPHWYLKFLVGAKEMAQLVKACASIQKRATQNCL